MDFSFFDVVLDSIIVFDKEKTIVYCNDPAAILCKSSVRRMTRGKKVYDFLKFENESVWSMPGDGSLGKDDVMPLEEMSLKTKDDEVFKGQVSLQPFQIAEEPLWALFVRDVTLEEVLHNKHKEQLEELEKYSKNLEGMVAERTDEINKINRTMQATMNSLGEGFLVFDENGLCSEVYTKACLEILETNPEGKHVAEVLNISAEERPQFDMWLQGSFSEALPFDTMKDLAPSLYQHSDEEKRITLDYFPIRNEEEKLVSLVMVATDVTSEYNANIALEREKHQAQMVTRLVTNKRKFKSFYSAIPGYLTEIEEISSGNEVDVDHLFRLLHTLEGESGTFSMQNIFKAAKHVQQVVTEFKDDRKTDFSEIREEFLGRLVLLNEEFEKFTRKNSELINMVGVQKENTFELAQQSVEAFYDKLKSQDIKQDILSDFEAEFLYQPISSGIAHYSELVTRIAEKQNKNLEEIVVKGGDLRVDFERFDSLFSSFVHVFRNIVDHGIESPMVRSITGKPEQAHVEFGARLEKGTLVIEISDDGGGIDANIIRKKWNEKNPDESLEGLSDEEVIQKIFDPGFSTTNEVTEFSGRGVGMDAVRYEVEALGGKLRMFSESGKGSRLVIQVPLIDKNKTLAEAS